MTYIKSNSTSVPEQALYELATEKKCPDADLLEKIIKKYPGYADVLTAFAVDLAIETVLESPIEDEVAFDPDDLDPAVSRAISRFQNRLHAERARGADDEVSIESKPVTSSSRTVNPFTVLDRKQFRTCATELGANVMFASKLRDRLVDPDTISQGFIKHVADKLSMELDIVAAHFLANPAGSSAGQFHKADDKPISGNQQSFEDAVYSSCLSSAQQQFLLSL